MVKRGQVTLFVVVALVVLIVVGLYLYARDQYGFSVPTAQYLSTQLIPLKENVDRCIQNEARPALVTLGHQGGSFNPAVYLQYKGNPVRVACAPTRDRDRCLNLLQPFRAIESELQAYLQEKIDTCIDRSLTSNKAYDARGTKNVNVSVDASDDAVTITVNYDLELVKDDQRVRMPKTSSVLRDAPLKKAYNAAVDIVNSHATTGTFDSLTYMLEKRGAYLIQTDRPYYPHILYKISSRGSTYEYWIAIEQRP